MPEGQPRESGVDVGRVQQADGRVHLMVEEHLDALQVVTEEDKSASDDRQVRE